MKTKHWTLKTIAVELGVSTATISNAFNRPDQLSSKKRQEILAACEELGYFGPNRAASSLRKGKSGIIGLILSDRIEYMVSDPVASQFMQGVAAELENDSINVLLFSGSSASINQVKDFVDGFICYGAPRNPVLRSELEKTDKRVVTVDFNLHACPSVNIDNRKAAYEIARQAIQTKEDQVAILGLRLIDSKFTCRVYEHELLDTQSSISHRRLDGYLDACDEANIDIRGENIWHVPESNEKFASLAAKEALTANNRPNVLLCMSDMIALSALKVAKQLGIQVPQQCRIVGFDGIDEAKRCIPELTTVEQNSHIKGQRAARLLLEQSSDNLLLDYALHLGGSS